AQPRQQVEVFGTDAVFRRIGFYCSNGHDGTLPALDADNVGTSLFRKKVTFVQARRGLLKDFFSAREIRLDDPGAERQVIRNLAPGLVRLEGNRAGAARN